MNTGGTLARLAAHPALNGGTHWPVGSSDQEIPGKMYCLEHMPNKSQEAWNRVSVSPVLQCAKAPPHVLQPPQIKSTGPAPPVSFLKQHRVKSDLEL